MFARFRLKEAVATARGALLYFTVYTFFFWLFGVIALGRVFTHGPLETFEVGSVPIPKWQGAGFTNLDVAIFCGVGILALAVAFIVRYVQHREKLQALRSRGIEDFNKDGKVDTFTDRFLDDL